MFSNKWPWKTRPHFHYQTKMLNSDPSGLTALCVTYGYAILMDISKQQENGGETNNLPVQVTILSGLLPATNNGPRFETLGS